MLKQKGWHPIRQSKRKLRMTNQRIKQQAQDDLRKVQENPNQKSKVSINVFSFVLVGFLSLFVLSLLAHW
ncbi:hypothetical protein [Fructobacillus fructosus]|uniref:Uncharacterized protein n=1 Tax=Fructobacillus fructosus TaxID=1631 RepID=A0ABM9MZP5_9LACO|nr:hypothetical protein [Fructobacillus fructosus]MBC9119286.1 hypothetical protein [Fructobacillus fructosus]MBD9366958.1 hypothetical protein [Leuconostoc mesenteroides]CAK1251424.1 unnamed protein product [Fructobacillus fructosus]